MMKRILLLLLTLVMVFSLCACGKPADPTETTGATEATQPSAPATTRDPLQPLLDKRLVPELKSRDEMLDILQKEMYGYIPAAPTDVTYTTQEDTIENYAAGKARIHKVTVSGKLNGNPFSFPFITAIPKSEEKVPFFVHIAFSSSNTHRFQPTEELIDHGYAVLFFNYEDVASDNSKLDNGIATALFPDGKRHNDDDPGKIAMWAWAASRVMDYAEKELADKLDFTRSIVCGHSRLGKTALLAGATDTRFQYVYSNDSGCTGAAISRYKGGENIYRVFNANPFWYAPGFAQYKYNEYKMPFDQHYLLACVAPRKLLVGSAAKDKTADPISEQLACLAASPAFENGFVCDGVALPGDEFFEGDIGYHMREGTHYFHREDWLKLIKFVEHHTNKAK